MLIYWQEYFLWSYSHKFKQFLHTCDRNGFHDTMSDSLLCKSKVPVARFIVVVLRVFIGQFSDKYDFFWGKRRLFSGALFI